MTAGDDVQETADGRSAPRLAAAPDRAVPLRALAVPLPNREVDRPDVRRLHGAEAVFALARYPRIVGWTDAHTSKNAHQHWGELLRRLPVVEVDIPWGPPFGQDLGHVLVEAILQHRP